MNRFKNILFFADGVHEPSTALTRAINLAESNGARLTIVDVLEPVDVPNEIAVRFDVDLLDILKQRRLETLNSMIDPYQQPERLIYTKVLVGKPFIEIIRSVKKTGYDLVMKAARPPAGLSERLFGSTDMHLLRKCPCPVWVDRPGAKSSYTRVLAAVDILAEPRDNCSQLVMALSTSLAKRESAEPAIVHAWSLHGESMLRDGRFRLSQTELNLLLDSAESRHRRLFDELLAPYQLATKDSSVYLIKGEAAPTIREVAEKLEADVIVMGTVGRSGIPGLFIGNTAEEVLQTTHASVLAVKPESFTSPVT